MKRTEIKKRLPNEEPKDIEDLIRFEQAHGYTPVWSWTVEDGWTLDFVLSDENSD